MINSLMRLLGDSSLANFENRIFEGMNRLNSLFNTSFSSLEDKEDHYELAVDVAEDAKASNVSVDYDDETRELSVKYEYKTKGFSTKSSIVERLPEDADEDKIDAAVEGGKLTITIAKKPVEEPKEEEVDDTVVKVNRKNKK